MLAALIMVTALCAMLLLPGFALLHLANLHPNRTPLQQTLLATGLGTASWPVLFYTARFLLPGLSIQLPLLLIFLLLCLVINARFLLRNGLRFPKVDRLEWIAVAVFALTFLSRFQFALEFPFPAWSDSLHHTLLTQLTAENGQLPYSLEPYFPNRLDMYHLGLYSLSGPLTILTRQPAHLTLLWTAQFLNAMCGFGIYLILDRYVGRAGAIVGAAVAGLFSVHPALWANWGRFTQLAGVVMAPFAWLMLVDLLQTARKKIPWRLVMITGFLSAAVFFLHFRVAVFYGLWAIFGCVAAIRNRVLPPRRDYESRLRRPAGLAIRRIVFELVGVGAVVLVLVLPVLVGAVEVYLANTAAITVAEVDPGVVEETTRNYFAFPVSVYPYLVAPVWLLWVTAVAALVGLWRRSWVTVTALLWAGALWLLGNAYRLEIAVLNVTNLGAVLIMFYLPIALVCGVGAHNLMQLLPERPRQRMVLGVLCALLAAGAYSSSLRANRIEPERHFVTGDDRAAMRWIEENVPEDAMFAINTYFWLPEFAHGVDAGYWIPYLTGREIMLSSMLSDGAPPAYMAQLLEWAAWTESLETGLDTLDELYADGIEYIYIGATGDFTGPGLRVDHLVQSPDVVVLFEQGDAAVLQITGSE